MMGDRHEKLTALSLVVSVVRDVADQTGMDLTRDIKTISDRFEVEGMNFLCKTLSCFGKHVIHCVEIGIYHPCGEFKHPRSRRPLPVFLQGLVDAIFYPDGTLRTEIDTKAFRGLMQITRMFSKLDVPYNEAENQWSIQKFIDANEANVRDHGSLNWTPDLVKIGDNMTSFLRLLLEDFDPWDIVPRHGPGAVLERKRLYDKYSFQFDQELDRLYPYDRFFSYRDCGDKESSQVPIMWYRPAPELGGLGQILESSDRYDRACLVPKDYRGPRFITVGSNRRQWIQQGLGKSLVKFIERDPLTKGLVNFTHQSVNQKLALSASASREWSTIDLSSASDRVSWALIAYFFPEHLVKCLGAVRATHVLLPGVKKSVQLFMHAGMGSAVCFPIEALYFFAIAVGTIAWLTGKDFAECAKSVRVYGDDIIVKTRYAHEVAASLEAFGLKVNSDKSFFQGPFRESCGIEAINGVEVQPLYCRKPPWLAPAANGKRISKRPRKRSKTRLSLPSPSWIVSHVSFANSLWQSGYKRGAWVIRNLVESEMGSRAVAMLQGETRFCWMKPEPKTRRYNEKLQKWEVRSLEAQLPKVGVNPYSSVGLIDYFANNCREIFLTDPLRDSAKDRDLLSMINLLVHGYQLWPSERIKKTLDCPSNREEFLPDPMFKGQLIWRRSWINEPE